jgi:hypothetical protein
VRAKMGVHKVPPTPLQWHSETIRYGSVLELRDSQSNFKTRPDGGGATVILKGSRNCPFRKGYRVMYDEVTLGDHVDFAAGYSLTDRSWPTKEVIRRMSLLHWGKVLRESLAAASASSAGASSLVLYDPLLLGGKLPYGDRHASYYVFAVVGKTPADVHTALEFANCWDCHGKDPPFPPASDSDVLAMTCSNGVFSASYKTVNFMEMRYYKQHLVLDALLSRTDHGPVRSLPVPGLVRVGFDNSPGIEDDVVRLCGESAAFCDMDAGRPAPAER